MLKVAAILFHCASTYSLINFGDIAFIVLYWVFWESNLTTNNSFKNKLHNESKMASYLKTKLFVNFLRTNILILAKPKMLPTL